MNITNIKTFLSIAYCDSITHAANALYVSQPTVSARLQQLEEELGVTLINRRKGMRSVELTPQGKAFIAIAERWVALDAETNQFQSQNASMLLSIACPDSLNNFMLNRFFYDLSSRDPSVRLNVRTHQSPEIFSLVDSREVDVGFAFLLSRYSNILCRPLFSEEMTLVCSAAGEWPDDPIRPDQLNPEHELYLAWMQEFRHWHDNWWNPKVPPFVQVDLAPMYTLYMKNPLCWAICPVSVAKGFVRSGVPIRIRKLSKPIPDRVCYILMNRSTMDIDLPVLKLFNERLDAFLAAQEDIRIISGETD